MADKISHYLPNKTTRDCVQYYYLNKKAKSFKEAYRKLELKYRRTYHLKSKNEKILHSPSLAFHQSTYEATRGPQWTEQIIARRARNDRAEAVLLRGFEGLDHYHELPADVVLVVEKEKGPTKRAAAAAARAEAAAAERRREEEAVATRVARQRDSERNAEDEKTAEGEEGREDGRDEREEDGKGNAHTEASECILTASETPLDACEHGKDDEEEDAMQLDTQQDEADKDDARGQGEADDCPDIVGVPGAGEHDGGEAAHRESSETKETDGGGADSTCAAHAAAGDMEADRIQDSVVEDSERKDVATDHEVETTLTRSNSARAHARAHDVGEGEDEKASMLQDTSERVPPVGVRQNEDSAAQEDKGRVLRNEGGAQAAIEGDDILQTDPDA